jgi:hypothetical protein
MTFYRPSSPRTCRWCLTRPLASLAWPLSLLLPHPCLLLALLPPLPSLQEANAMHGQGTPLTAVEGPGSAHNSPGGNSCLEATRPGINS